jgi:hypothetical protein
MMVLNKYFWRRAADSPETIFQVRAGEIPVFYRNDSQQLCIEQEDQHFEHLLYLISVSEQLFQNIYRNC